MNTYTWRINALDCKILENDLQNVVYGIHWSYLCEDENKNMASSVGVQIVSAPNLDSFTPYESLTHEIVVGWLLLLISEEEISEMQSSLSIELERRTDPLVVTLELPNDQILD